MNSKPPCYSCVHRSTVARSHTQCVAPGVGETFTEGLLIAIGIRKPPFVVQGDEHGISHGWFNWPIDFDPIWLTRCDGYKSENGDSSEVKTSE